jgi:hypothetical protein
MMSNHENPSVSNNQIYIRSMCQPSIPAKVHRWGHGDRAYAAMRESFANKLTANRA